MITIPIWLAFAVPAAAFAALLALVWLRDRERRAWFANMIALLRAARSRDDDDDDDDDTDQGDDDNQAAYEAAVKASARTCPHCEARFWPADPTRAAVCTSCGRLVKP